MHVASLCIVSRSTTLECLWLSYQTFLASKRRINITLKELKERCWRVVKTQMPEEFKRQKEGTRNMWSGNYLEFLISHFSLRNDEEQWNEICTYYRVPLHSLLETLKTSKIKIWAKYFQIVEISFNAIFIINYNSFRKIYFRKLALGDLFHEYTNKVFFAS